MKLVAVKKSSASLYENIPDNDITIISVNDIKEYSDVLIEECKKRSAFLAEFCDKNNYSTKDDKIKSISFEYMYEKTEPILVVIESFSDFISECDDETKIIYKRLFEIAGKLNIYILALVYPGDASMGDSLTDPFKKNELWFMFGGNLKNQKFISMRGDMLNIPDVDRKFNEFIMYYRKKLYLLCMPCGHIEEENVEPDDENIFEVD